MYIKKPKAIIAIIAIVIVTAIITAIAINPFGLANFGNFLKLSYATKMLNLFYYEDVNLEEASQMAIAGVAASVEDQYTGYMWGDDAVQYMEEVEGSYCGVGLYIEWDVETDLISVVSSIAGGPAESAGISTNDKIIKIDGKTYQGSELNEAASYMRGKEGTDVTLTIRSAVDDKEREVVLTRSEIVIESVTGEMLENGIGYICITQFIENVAEDLEAQYKTLKEQGMRALIIDLRNNPGGLLDEAVDATSLFVDEGAIVTYTLDKYEYKEEYKSTREEKVFEDIPVVVLINGGSASASEVMTGAFRDYKLATIIGQKSYGKGVVQSVIPIGDDLMSVTISRYYTPNGECIHEKGIEPDIEIEMSLEKSARLSTLPHSEDEQLLRAIEYLNNN